MTTESQPPEPTPERELALRILREAQSLAELVKALGKAKGRK